MTATVPHASAPLVSERGRLGQWNSAVASYYVTVGATSLLVALGLVMVLSSSAIDSIAETGNPYVVFLRQAQFALIGLVGMFVASRLPLSFI